jgi:fatty-acyl-CoA synthase
MRAKLIKQTASAYGYPLLIKELLWSGVNRAPEQEIVYGNGRRMLYRELGERVGRLASGLAGLGVGPGGTVGVMDWDSSRYLECSFAVPMMGAVLHTINVRLSPEQILYTINHAEDDVILSRRCPKSASASTTKSFCARDTSNSHSHSQSSKSAFIREPVHDDVSRAAP